MNNTFILQGKDETKFVCVCTHLHEDVKNRIKNKRRKQTKTQKKRKRKTMQKKMKTQDKTQKKTKTHNFKNKDDYFQELTRKKQRHKFEEQCKRSSGEYYKCPYSGYFLKVSGYGGFGGGSRLLKLLPEYTHSSGGIIISIVG